MIVGVATGTVILLGLGLFLWRMLQNRHALEVQRSTQNHEFEMEGLRNDGSMLRLAESQEGLMFLRNLYVGRQIGGGGAANRLQIGLPNEPHAGGGGGRVYDVSLS